MISIIIVNIWRGVPFFAISLLAGLQTISPELNEAAAIDGAKPWQRFWHVTWPLLLPVTMVVVLFSVIQTFADFQIVYVMTGGGPANGTQSIAYYTYQRAFSDEFFGYGAALAYLIVVFIMVLAIVYIRLLRSDNYAMA
jgi:multiple sugar transport system permease protein